MHKTWIVEPAPWRRRGMNGVPPIGTHRRYCYDDPAHPGACVLSEVTPLPCLCGDVDCLRYPVLLVRPREG